eukprot:765121-Hanusia_phi.AAC.2
MSWYQSRMQPVSHPVRSDPQDPQGCVCDASGCYPNNWLASYDLYMYQSIATDSELFPRYLVSIYFATVTLTTVSTDRSSFRDRSSLETERAHAVTRYVSCEPVKSRGHRPGAGASLRDLSHALRCHRVRFLCWEHLDAGAADQLEVHMAVKLPRCFMAEYLTPVIVQKDETLFEALDVGFVKPSRLAALMVCDLDERRCTSFLKESLKPGIPRTKSSEKENSWEKSLCSLRFPPAELRLYEQKCRVRRNDFHDHIRPYFPDVYEAIKKLVVAIASGADPYLNMAGDHQGEMVGLGCSQALCK